MRRKDLVLQGVVWFRRTAWGDTRDAMRVETSAAHGLN